MAKKKPRVKVLDTVYASLRISVRSDGKFTVRVRAEHGVMTETDDVFVCGAAIMGYLVADYVTAEGESILT